MSSSSDARVTALPMPELGTGQWTRLGDRALLGDAVSEALLGDVAGAVRAAARAQGYAVGWAEGRRAAEAAAAEAAALAEQRRQEAETRREAEHRAALAALLQAAEEVHATLATLCERVEQQATELAWAVTEALVGREVASLTGSDVVRRILTALPNSPVVTVRIHPDLVDAEAVGQLRARGVEVVGDPGLDRADALVLSDGRVIDLRVSSALDRVREVLR